MPPRVNLRIPPRPNPPPPRRSGRLSGGGTSGSEYQHSERSAGPDISPTGDVILEQAQYTTSSRGRKRKVASYKESSECDSVGLANEDGQVLIDGDDEDDDDVKAAPRRRNTRSSGMVIESDEDGEAAIKHTRSSNRTKPTNTRTTRSSKKNVDVLDDEYVAEPSSSGGDADGSTDDMLPTSEDGEVDAEGDIEDHDQEGDDDGEGRPYALRQRAKINYAIPPPLEEMPPPAHRPKGGRPGGARNGRNKARPGWSATGAELSRWMGMAAGDDSDSDNYTRTPRKPFGAAAGGVYGGTLGGGGMMPSDLAAVAGTPSNLGKIGDSALADADPLGVNTNVTFDEVGGLDDHIHSLKEMTLLPLLYPEVFQRFSVTPPRGVLFHGPPGTGKTLLARALAASCRSNGKQISFFMRKGADCLSKWVGEAERQLRLLFEEARTCQPSIIFFDEIDGLAPVRSSKQDQIHASIVSTLLALMDGMDGRGQVIVIGATNRPDAVDPALRRPGRFDREFYFPLPGLEAREKILSIMTREWEGWKGDDAKEKVGGLAKLTKGYGGADLRALCTEAALNAVQRRYPQIYKSNDRLLLKPETIGVTLRDFMISIKKLVPSSARSSTSAAAQLPTQFVPLLSDALDRVKNVIAKVLPVDKKRSALEEAEYEDDDEDGALEREMMLQSMETLRVHRPRVVVYGSHGMGQGYIGAAALHHLEGYHVQSLELGGLLGDSTRTPEAAIVQLFVEAKRHQPSVVYIPSLVGWCAAVSETCRSTVRSMLDTIAPTDPILLLAIVDGPFSSLPREVRAWFGPTHANRVHLSSPTPQQRERFFEGLLKDIQRPPNQFADGVKRKKRVLEELPIAPPLEPKLPTAAELAVQEENDVRVITLLKYRLGPIMDQLKRKFKRFTKRATEEYDFNIPDQVQVETVIITGETDTGPNGVSEVVEQERITEIVVNGHVDVETNGDQAELPPMQVQEPPPSLYDMDLERMHLDLYKGKYLTPQDFLEDIQKMVHNAAVRAHEDVERLYKAQAMLTAAEVSVNEFDPQLRLECDRMAVRERKRREERRKLKDKGKATDASAAAVATRRSARHNGQPPEIPITDPLKLERRLKRQRPDGVGVDSQGSEGETSESRMAKKTKMVVSDDEDDDHDPLDIVGPTSSQPRPIQVVRFSAQVDPLAPLGEDPDVRDDEPNQMVVDPLPPPPSPQVPRRTAGFDSTLLNPLPEHDDVFTVHSSVNGVNGFLQPEQSTSTMHIPPFQPQYTIPTHPPSPHPDPLPLPLEPASLAPEERPLTPTPIIVERTPTPHPAFCYDEIMLSRLKYNLREDTRTLTVEQLEQLRATCLGCVWRHRSDWDRDELIREVKDVVTVFIHEVVADEQDEDA